MTCTCQTQPDTFDASNSTPEPAVTFQAYEAYGINTALDGSKMFWGYLHQPATVDLVVIDSERAGSRSTLTLRPLSADTIVDVTALPAGTFVFGAYKPNSVFHIDDNSSSDLGNYEVQGTLVVIEPSLFTPSRTVPVNHVTAAIDRFKYVDPSDGQTHTVFDQIGVTTSAGKTQVILRFLEAGRTVVLDGRDVIEVFALLNSAFTLEMAINLFALFRDGYILGKVDAVPCRPGIQSGQVFAVWRLYHPQTAERVTLVQRSDLRSIGDVHLPVTVDPNAPPVDYVDPDKWDPEFCSRCRRSCAKVFLECIKVSQDMSGPEAVKKYKECLDDARACYEKCMC